MSEIDDCSRKEYEQESLVKEEHEISCNNINLYGAKTFQYPNMPLTSLDQKYFQSRTFPCPDKSKDYIQIGPESNGIYREKYKQLLQDGYNLHLKYGGLVRGHYLPVWV